LEADTALSALDIWQYPSSLDRDTCAISSETTARKQTGSRGGQFRMRLLDVGPLRVRTADRDMTLEPRRIPDLSRAFSGVVYGLDQTMQTSEPSDGAAAPLPYRPGATYQFSAPGGRTTSGFEVALEAPRPLTIESIHNQSGAQQWRHLGAESAVSVRWASTSDGKAVSTQEGNDIFMDVAAANGSGHLTCRLTDDGQFTLPSELVEEVAADGSALTFVLRRVQSRQIQIPGLDETRLTMSATDVRRVATDLLRE
jgi:hypothetical protein